MQKIHTKSQWTVISLALVVVMDAGGVAVVLVEVVVLIGARMAVGKSVVEAVQNPVAVVVMGDAKLHVRVPVAVLATVG